MQNDFFLHPGTGSTNRDVQIYNVIIVKDSYSDFINLEKIN